MVPIDGGFPQFQGFPDPVEAPLLQVECVLGSPAPRAGLLTAPMKPQQVLGVLVGLHTEGFRAFPVESLLVSEVVCLVGKNVLSIGEILRNPARLFISCRSVTGEGIAVGLEGGLPKGMFRYSLLPNVQLPLEKAEFGLELAHTRRGGFRDSDQPGSGHFGWWSRDLYQGGERRRGERGRGPRGRGAKRALWRGGGPVLNAATERPG